MSRLPLAMHNTPAPAPTKKPYYKGQWGTQTLRPATPNQPPYNGQSMPFPISPQIPSAGTPNTSLMGKIFGSPQQPPASDGQASLAPQGTALASRLQGPLAGRVNRPEIVHPILRIDPATGRSLGADGKPSTGPAISHPVMRFDPVTGRAVNEDGSPVKGPAISLAAATSPVQQEAPTRQAPQTSLLAAPPIPRPAPGNPGYDGLSSDEVIAKARGEAQSQLDDPNYIPATQQGWEAKQARQNELAGQRRAASVADMLSGGGTRAMNENGMAIVNGSGAPLPNTVRGSVGSDNAPVYRPDGTRMVEPVGGWNPNQMTESMPLSPQAQGLRDAMQKRYDAAQAARQQTLMARINGQLPPATGPRADSSNPRWMAAREARQERRDAARALIAQRGMAEAANRTARIEARRAATLPPNPLQMMAMRNPALALGMQRMALDAQQANLDRAIQREELDIRRSALTGDLDERKQARLDAMKQQQAENDLKRQQLDQSGELGRAQIAQDQAQHDENMRKLDIENNRYGDASRRDREEKRAAALLDLQSQHGNTWTAQDYNDELNRMFPPETTQPQGPPSGAPGAPVPDGTGTGGSAQPPTGELRLPNGKPYYKPGAGIPRQLKGAASEAMNNNDPSAFARQARLMGYAPEYIDMMWRELVSNPSASIAEPEGPTLWDAIGGIGTYHSDDRNSPYQRWRRNPGNRT